MIMAKSLFIKFNPVQIEEVASFIQVKQGELLQSITGIRQRTNTLKQSWKSDRRADSFYNGIAELEKKGEEMVKTLNTLNDSLYKAAGVYKTGEGDVKKGVQTLPTEGVFRN